MDPRDYGIERHEGKGNLPSKRIEQKRVEEGVEGG